MKMIKAVLKNHLILMRIRILDLHWKKWIRIRVISLRFTDFFNKNNFYFFLFYFFTYFYLKTIQKWGNFYNLPFIKSSDLGFISKNVFFLQFLVDILPIASGSVDLHIFADPDSMHWIKAIGNHQCKKRNAYIPYSM